MGCTTSCIAPSIAELNKSLKAGDERAMLLQLAACPKLLSTTTSVLSSTGITPLHVACENRQTKVVQQVISFLSCSSLDVVSEALLPYCRRAGLAPPTSVAEGVRIAVDMANGKGQTPLMYACYADSPDLVKLLLDKGADPWVGDRCGRRTALHYAAMGGSVGAIEALMAHVPPRLLARGGTRYIDARSMCGLTPLHYCAFFGRTSALAALLRHGPCLAPASACESYDMGLTVEVGSTPLHFAAMRGHGGAARELLLAHAARVATSQAPAPDPRLRADAAGQLPWQVASAHHPADVDLAAMLHPGVPLERATRIRVGASSSSWAEEEGEGEGGGGPHGPAAAHPGPATLAALAAAALREKLLADVRAVQDRAAAAAATVAAAPEAATAGVAATEEEAAEGQEEGEGGAAACVLDGGAVVAGSGGDVGAHTAGGEPAPGARSHQSLGHHHPQHQQQQQQQEKQQEQQPQQQAHGQVQHPRRPCAHGCGCCSAAPHPCACRRVGEGAHGPRQRREASGAGAPSAAGAPPPRDDDDAVVTGGAADGAPAGAASEAAAGAPSAAVLPEQALQRGGGVGGGPAFHKQAAVLTEAGALEGEDEGLCGVCFAAPEEVAPTGCRHGLCGACAAQLATRLGGAGAGAGAGAGRGAGCGAQHRPLRCPFCRRLVTGFVAL